MPVDTSIYGQVAPPADPFSLPNKLLQMQQGSLGAQNSQLQNQLLQRNLGGQQAVQDALSAATKPDGTIDLGVLGNKLSGTPGMASMPEITQQGQHIAGNNISITKQGQDLTADEVTKVGQAFGAAQQTGGPFGWKDANKIINDLVASGQIRPSAGGSILHMMPTRRGDAAVKTWATQNFIRTLPNTGATVGQIGVTPSGAPVTGTTGQAVTRAVGAVPTDASGNALNPDGTPTSNNLNPKTGIVTPPAGKPAPTMGYVSGLAPGQANAADISQQSAANQAAQFEKQANAATDSKATIANMQDQLAKIATGPYADRINNAKAGFNELVDATGLPLPQFDKGSIAALDEFRKNGQILANQQFATLGGTGTDAQLSAAVHSNPGTFMSNLSNKQIMQMLQGNQDAIEAKATAWRQYQKQAGAGANFNTFSEDFNRNFSPRAFQFVHMSPSERSDMVKGMTPVEKGQLNNALQTAMDRGWINKPGASQ